MTSYRKKNTDIMEKHRSFYLKILIQNAGKST